MLYSFSILDLFPYFALYTLTLYSAIKNNRIIYQLCFIFVLLFSSLRYGIGYDYFNYVEIIEDYNVKYFSSIEWLSQIFYFIAQKTHIQVFFAINSFICLFPIYFLSIKFSSSPALVFFAYVTIPLFFLESLSIIRYSSALSLFLLAYYYLGKKEYFKYILLSVIAGGIHTTGYLALSLPLLTLYRNNKVVNIIIFCLGGIFHIVPMIQIVDLLPNSEHFIYLKLYRYMTNIEPQSGMMSIAVFAIGLFNLLCWNRLIKLSSENEKYMLLYNIGIFCWGLFSFNKTLSLRISSYFLIFVIFLIPMYIFMFKNKRKSSSVVYLFLSLYFLSSFLINIRGYNASLYNRVSYLPYQTIFNQKDYQNYKFRFQ